MHVFSKAWSLQGEGYEPVAFKRPYMRWAHAHAHVMRHVQWAGALRTR